MLSDTRTRNTKSLSSRMVIAGEVAAGDMCSVLVGMVTALATARVEPLATGPMMTSAPSTLTRARAASVDAWGLVAPSRWTTLTGLPSNPPASLMMRADISMAERISGPKSDRSPVKSRTVPMVTGAFSWAWAGAAAGCDAAAGLSAGGALTSAGSAGWAQAAIVSASAISGASVSPRMRFSMPKDIMLLPNADFG